MPFTQFKAKSFLRGSKIEYLPSIVTEQKFNDAVKNLTIFIDKKENNLLHNVLIKEELSKASDSKYIFVTGGLGGTVDDTTIDAIGDQEFIPIQKKLDDYFNRNYEKFFKRNNFT